MLHYTYAYVIRIIRTLLYVRLMLTDKLILTQTRTNHFKAGGQHTPCRYMSVHGAPKISIHYDYRTPYDGDTVT